MTVKASDVLKTVKKLGKKHPDRSRPCQYVRENGKGCCIVGTALLKHGLDPQVFLADDDLNGFTDVRRLFLGDIEDETDEGYAAALGLEQDLSEAELEKLRRVQTLQDQGEPWGQAIAPLR